MNKIEIYTALVTLVSSHKDLVDSKIFEVLVEALETSHVEELFGLELDRYGDQYYRVKDTYDDWFRILYYSKESPGLSWPDDNKQPRNEWGYVMSFPTGAYMFGDSYPVNTFNAMFQELKDMGAKYSDSVNHSLVFPPEIASKVIKSYPDICKKYQSMVQSELKEKRKIELQQELEKLNQG